jgi:hypothetical protein
MRYRTAFAVLSFALAAPIAAQVPTTFTNLQVLPKDIAQRPLVDTMRGFVFALDVRCEFCHVGEGNDLSRFDFASDAKPTKVTARAMLRMLAGINTQLAPIAEPTSTPKATCFTCHRGALKPLTAPARRGGTRSTPVHSRPMR